MTRFTIITFGTAEFSWAIAAQRRQALKLGAHRHIAYGIGSDAVVTARSQNPQLASNPRGYGLWIWKPYILLDALAQCEAGDYLIYLDAGVAPIADMTPWFAQLRQRPINLFAPVPPRDAREWTKRDCFVYLKADTPRFHAAPMLSAGIQAYCNVTESHEFIAELQALMRMPLLLTDPDGPQAARQYDGFAAHRHDQSILTLLAALRGITIQREPSQYGIWTSQALRAHLPAITANPGLLNEDCPQVLDVHRGRNRSNALLQQLWVIRRRMSGSRRRETCI